MKEIGGDFLEGYDPAATATLKKKAAAKKGKVVNDPGQSEAQNYPSRNVGVGGSQVFLSFLFIILPLFCRSCSKLINLLSASFLQIGYIRTLLDAAFNEKAPGMKGGFMKDTDFSSSEVTEMSNNYRQSFFYPFVLNLSGLLSLTFCHLFFLER